MRHFYDTLQLLAILCCKIHQYLNCTLVAIIISTLLYQALVYCINYA